MKEAILFILTLILNIFLVNAQLAKVYNEDNLDFDRAYKEQYLKDYNYFSNIDFVKTSGGYTTVMKVGNVNDNIKGVNINNEKKYAIHLLYCNAYSYCAFRINGVPFPQARKDSTFQLDDLYTMKITNIVFNYCDTKAFCNIGFEAYNIVDLVIDGPSLIICGNNICEAGENCKEDDCCNGEKAFLDNNEQNCGSCGISCGEGGNCVNGKCECRNTQYCDICKSEDLGNSCDCDKECGSNFCFSGLCAEKVGEMDLSGYPYFFIKDGKLEVTTVVGDKSSSSNVLAQTYIVSSLSSLGRDVNLKNKLSSEIQDLNQNIISIGNPCINEISAKIMNNPNPCNKDFQNGKGYIKLYKNDGFFHLIVAGYTDLGTKKAAEILANYENYKFQGNEYVVDVAEPTIEIKIEEKKKEDIAEIEITEKEPSQKTEVHPQELLNKTKEKQEKPKEIKIEAEKSKQVVKEETNIIKKVIVWFLSLFR